MIRDATKLLFFLFVCLSAVGQRVDNIPFFKGYQSNFGIYHWTTSNGLPQSHIAGITQTENRMVYIATNNGVCSTDGRRFNRLTGSEFNTLNPSVTAISHIGDSVIWASGKEVVLYFDRKIVSIWSLPNDFSVSEIRWINGKWYLMGATGILTIEGKKIVPVFLCDHQLIIKGKKLIGFSVVHNTIYSLVSDPKGRNWIFGYNLVEKSESQISPKLQVEKIVTLNNYLHAFDGTNWYHVMPSGRTSIVNLPTTKLSGSLQSDLFYTISYYYNGSELLLKTNQGESLLHVNQFLHENQINASFVDHSGNLWLGTTSYGLFLFRHYPFSYVFPTQQAVIRNSSSAFLDAEGIIWTDNDCQEIIAADPKTHKVVNVLKNICSQSAVTWSKDTVAFFGNNTVHHWYDRRKNEVSVIQNLQIRVTSAYRLNQKSVLLSTPGKLLIWDGHQTAVSLKFFHPSTTVNEFCKLTDGTIIIATTEGVFRLTKGGWKAVLGKKELGNPDCRSLQLLESKNKLLIGTAGSGIVSLDLRTNGISTLKQVPPQIQFCWSILEDAYGQLWITSNNGIIQINLADLLLSFETQQNFIQLNRYQYESGIDNAEFNSKTQDKSDVLPDGQLVFSGLGGPILVNPENNQWFNSRLSNIIFERITVNDNDVSPLVHQLNIHEGDFAQFIFTLPAFSNERILSFEYRLKGLRDEWTSLNSRQVITDNLPAGDYVLEIRLVSQQRIIRLPIHVEANHPFIWILWILMSLGVLFSAAWLVTKAIRIVKQRRLNQAIVEKRLKVLEAEALRSQMNPHFIFNCLNTIQFLFITGNVDKANKYLSDFSALMRLTLDLLRKSLTNLETELRAIELYVELEKLQFDNGFEYRLINNLKTPMSQIKTPTLFLQIFVENAIVHGLRDISVTNPVLSIILEEENDVFRIRICDNGPGFGKSSSSETHNSVGTDLAIERFRLKNEIYHWDITYSSHEYTLIENDVHTEVCITFSKLAHISDEEE